MLSPVHIAAFCGELPLLLLHASVFAFIACEIWNGKTALRSTFYYVYAVLTCADCCGYLLTVYSYRFVPAGIITPIEPWTSIVYVVIGYSAFVQFVAHAAIAVNRLTTITKLDKPQFQRSRTVCVVTLVLVLILPLPGAILRWFPSLRMATYAMSMAYSGISCIVSVSLELRSFRLFRRMPVAIQREFRSDFSLLLYALLQLVGQTLITLFYSANFVSMYFAIPEIGYASQQVLTFIVDLNCLSGSICLLAMSKTVRTSYRQFYGGRSSSIAEASSRTFATTQY